MSLTFTPANSIRLALMQVAVVVFGVLGAGVGWKVTEVVGTGMPTVTAFMMNYGAILLLAPLGWTFLAFRVRASDEIPDSFKVTVFAGGLVLVLLLAGLAAVSTVAPFCLTHGLGAGPPAQAVE